MLARDYSSVGSKGSFIGTWGTKDFVVKLGSVGTDHDGAVSISDTVGNVVQVHRYSTEYSRLLRSFEVGSAVRFGVSQTDSLGSSQT